MAENELLELQTVPEAPKPVEARTKTSMLLVPTRMSDRLRHFPEEVYDLRAESHLVRFLKVLLGDAGAGQLRKRLTIQRLQSTLQGTHFYDLDRFYGALFGVRRSQGEMLDFDPYSQTATRAQWDDVRAKDASFRSRIEQFSRALTYGPTPTGMELISEALLAVDCEVYESYVDADATGTGERRLFTVRPKRAVTLAEAYDLRRVLTRIKPADARFVIDPSGIALHDPITINGIAADSDHWEVVPEVVAPIAVNNPYQVASGNPEEQPRPPFSTYQGEAWSYNADIKGPSAYIDYGLERREVLPPQAYVMADGTVLYFDAPKAIMPALAVQAGRVVSDGVLVSQVFSGPRGVPSLYTGQFTVQTNAEDVARLYADGIPLDELNRLLKDQRRADASYQSIPEHRYWLTAERLMDDSTAEVLEVQLNGDRLINYVSFEVTRFPHQVSVEVYNTLDATWVPVLHQTFRESIPKYIRSGMEDFQGSTGGHPHHSTPGHWEKVSYRLPTPVEGSRLRIRLQRGVEGNPPMQRGRTTGIGTTLPPVEVPYSLGIRGLDLGYRVTSRKDFDFLDPAANGVIAKSQDIAGSVVQFRVREHLAENLLAESDYWRCEPQPVNYSVVNLYLDSRNDPAHTNGDGVVIDRFYLDPTHVGAHFSIYYTNDPQDIEDFPDLTAEEFYEARSWTPIPRDYTLQKGFVHLPPTRARYFKFEFTNLTAEPYENFLATTRRVKMFPRWLVDELTYGTLDADVPQDMAPMLDVARRNLYSDALGLLSSSGETDAVEGYRATEAMYFPNPSQAEKVSGQSWAYGFTPWHQGMQAPRFSRQGRHTYESIEIKHTGKVAFFVGLKSIKAYRTNYGADEDTQVYFDTFDDFRNLTAGFTWTFEPGYMTTATFAGGVTEAVSQTFTSLHDVRALQFATQQAFPKQLVPDHDFRWPGYSTYGWDNPDDFMRVGDAQLIYQERDNQVLVLRYVVPTPKSVDPTHTIVQPMVHPPFVERSYTAADDAAAAATEGGLASPLVGLSDSGRTYAAVRLTVDSDLSSPLWLQIVDNATGNVLVEKSITGQRGQVIEEYLAYDIPSPGMVVRVRVIQRGKADDAWKIDSLAMFDESITWEFSNDGGTTWVSARGIRNNDTGVLTFPTPGNQLRYRVRGYRADMWVSAIKIRPWYVGEGQNARSNGTHRGPNLSVYDHDVPIHEDPMFTEWRKPIPYWWFAISKKYPLLPVEGIPDRNEFSRFYGRPVNDTVAAASDSVSTFVLRRRFGTETLSIGDDARRPIPITWRLVRPIVSPTGLGRPDNA